MLFGNMPRDGGHLFLTVEEAAELRSRHPTEDYVRRFVGADELISGKQRYCLWIEDSDAEKAMADLFIATRMELVAANRRQSPASSTRDFAARPYRFVQIG